MFDEQPNTHVTRPDRGMTLTELLIAVSIMGLIAAVLATSIIVTLRQHDNTEGRLNVARAEQNVSMWIPADLSSADTVDTNPGATPCGNPVCDGIDLSNGSNVLQLTWSEVLDDGGIKTTTVSYNFYQAPDGTFELRRIECVTAGGGWDCSSNVVLRDLPGPPGTEGFTPGAAHGADACMHDEWVPNPAYPSDPPGAPAQIQVTVGTTACTRPTWVIVVSEPLEPCAGLTDQALLECEGDPSDPVGEVKDANRVVVSINGGGDGDGAGGGVNQVSITAGGTVRRTIPADSLLGAPTFVEARSRCGGPITLIIDQSTSIPSDGRTQVKNAARAFVETLQGTPTQIQVVEFDTRTDVLGGGWHHYYDMTVQADWEALKSAISAMSFGGDTNWEDALYRTFYAQNGSTPQIVPETVVFFTDGVPTVDRAMGTTYRATGSSLQALPLPYTNPPWPSHQGGVYHQGSYNRAEYIAAKVRAEQREYVRLIGVGVGGVNDPQTWITNPGAGYVTVWERGYVRYKQIADSWQSRLDFERATGFESKVDYERRTKTWSGGKWKYGSWQDTDAVTYHNAQGGYEYRNNGSRNNWYDVSEAVYDAYRSDGEYQAVDWVDQTPSQYAAGQPGAPSKYHINGPYRSWYNVTAEEFAKHAPPSGTGPRFGTSSDWRPATQETWISKATYDANVGADPTHYVDTGVTTYISVSQAKDFQVVSAQGTPTDQYRLTKTYPSTPPAGGYTGYDSPLTELPKPTGGKILARMIAGSDLGIPYVPDPDGSGPKTDNAEIANMYLLGATDWSLLPGALRTVALGECGGTLTVSTRKASGGNVADPVVYENSAAFDSSGELVSNFKPSTVTTNAAFANRTLDFSVPGGTFITAELRPQASSTMLRYNPGGWACRAGATPLVQGTDFEVFDIPITITSTDGTQTTELSGWTGVRIKIEANKAVSCVLTLTPK